ncbi:hypothetical protein RhiirC2_704429 [Rhizophagus irregularis]|uniref:Uncharacterized protein n=1 Tax=Rhizophagus irregularis TaxID=588596 RepID=A0A2N1P274_9GLOM|nr:hypothetical protein RhiirC2_704429 [Rhizophagus irregularis]
MDIRAVVAIDFGTTFSNVIKWGNPALAQRQSVKDRKAEAAAVYCMRNLKNLKGQNEIIPVNAPFMIVDCGGGTVDLTTRRLLRNKKVKRVKKNYVKKYKNHENHEKL